MEILLGLIIVILLAGFAFLFYALNQKLASLRDDNALGLIKQDLVGMSQTLTQTQQHISDRLDKAAGAFSDLNKELGQMQELGRSMKDIQDVLKSPKLRGNIGEQLMADLIRQHIPRASFDLQHSFRSKETVDAVIKTRNGMIPVDAKFPAENFLKFSQADGEAERAQYHKLFTADVKKQINDIAKKYIVTDEGTVDFALMYVPGEAIYYEIMTNTDLGDYAAGQRVYLVSPHSFYYFLRTVLLGLEGELIEQQAREVMNYLKGIQSDARKFGNELDLVSKHLGNAKSNMDRAVVSYEKLSGKIDSANQLTREPEPVELPLSVADERATVSLLEEEE